MRPERELRAARVAPEQHDAVVPGYLYFAISPLLIPLISIAIEGR
jgi:hypothetical protein